MNDTEYQVTITLSEKTLEALRANGFSLYGFQGVSSPNSSGVPLVWFGIRDYLTDTTVAWVAQYEAYVSTSPLGAGGRVSVGSSFAVRLGQTLQVQDGGIGAVFDGGPPSAISFSNLTDVEFTCGLSSPHGGAFAPVCAFPLEGSHMDVIAPIEKVLLMFAAEVFDAGDVVEQAFAPGILIDLSAADEVGVSFDIDAGWSGPTEYATKVDASADLVPLLIEALAG